jgi:hypothetical protein
MTIFSGLVHVNLLGSTAGLQSVSNSFHISKPSSGSPPSLSDLSTLAADLNGWLGAAWRGVLVTNATHVSITCKQVKDPTTPLDTELEQTLPVNLPGSRSISAAQVPISLCAVVRLRTPNASRRFRGHLMAPPMTSGSAVNGNNLVTTDAYYTQLQAFVAKLQAGCGPTTSWTGTLLPQYFLSIYSKTAAKLAQPSVATCIAVDVNPQARWLRSRERGTT